MVCPLFAAELYTLLSNSSYLGKVAVRGPLREELAILLYTGAGGGTF